MRIYINIDKALTLCNNLVNQLNDSSESGKTGIIYTRLFLEEK